MPELMRHVRLTSWPDESRLWSKRFNPLGAILTHSLRPKRISAQLPEANDAQRLYPPVPQSHQPQFRGAYYQGAGRIMSGRRVRFPGRYTIVSDFQGP
jgi:hypothetical protein